MVNLAYDFNFIFFNLFFNLRHLFKQRSERVRFQRAVQQTQVFSADLVASYVWLSHSAAQKECLSLR